MPVGIPSSSNKSSPLLTHFRCNYPGLPSDHIDDPDEMKAALDEYIQSKRSEEASQVELQVFE